MTEAQWDDLVIGNDTEYYAVMRKVQEVWGCETPEDEELYDLLTLKLEAYEEEYGEPG